MVDLTTGEKLNLSTTEENAFWAWAVIEILRYSGIFSGGRLAVA